MTSNGPSFTVVLIGDDEIRSQIEPALHARDDLLLIGSVGAEQGIATAVGRSPDIVVIADPPGPGASTAALGRQIGAALPASRLLVVRHGGGAADPSALIDAWIGGVVAADDAVADAVVSLVLGEAMVDAGLATAILERHRAGGSDVALTATEEEVLGRIAGGAAVAVVATEYAVTPRLVRQHAGGALARLHPRS